MACHPWTKTACKICQLSGCWTKRRTQYRRRTKQWFTIRAWHVSKPRLAMGNLKTTRCLKILSPLVNMTVCRILPLRGMNGSDFKKTLKLSMKELFQAQKRWDIVGSTKCRQVCQALTCLIWSTPTWKIQTHFPGKICLKWHRPLTWMQSHRSGPSVTTSPFQAIRSRSLKRFAFAWLPLLSRLQDWRAIRRRRCTWQRAWLIAIWPCWPCISRRVPVLLSLPSFACWLLPSLKSPSSPHSTEWCVW